METEIASIFWTGKKRPFHEVSNEKKNKPFKHVGGPAVADTHTVINLHIYENSISCYLALTTSNVPKIAAKRPYTKGRFNNNLPPS